MTVDKNVMRSTILSKTEYLGQNVLHPSTEKKGNTVTFTAEIFILLSL